eukprot:PITA_24068
MPFGLTNDPTTFMRMMNDVLKPFIDDFVIFYLDDILIFSKLRDEHVMHVNKVLDVLRKEQLFLKMSKCEFGKTSLAYLGHIVGGGELKIDPSKVEVILNWPNPNIVTEVRSFLGATQYWRKFIANFSSIAAPLHALTSVKKVFHWGNVQHKAFDALKQKIISTLVLALLDLRQPFEIQTNLHYIHHAYNREKHSSTNTSRFEACYGYLPRSPLDFIFEEDVAIEGHSDIDKARKFIEKIQLIHHTVQEHLEKSQSSYKARHEKHRVNHKFQVGDEVWLYISKERHQGEGKNLKPICYGPFKILKKIGNNEFKLDFPPYMQIYYVVNVENLRLFGPPLIYDQGKHVQLPSIDDFLPKYLDEIQQDLILDKRIKTSKRGDVEYLRVGLKGQNPSQAKWL